MKIQNLAVIFIIIVLPISMILTSYVQSQVKTLSLQTEYDAKLNNATYDAVKAFQINTINSDSSDLANSKLRDIEASVNSFFTSIANNFNMAGYNQDILKEYVPALVYTMYDGYYIYSPYTNTLDNKNKNEVVIDEYGNTDGKSDAEILNENNPNATYKEGERLSGLKPYIYYSCRYKRSNGDDFVITYSLDNYITIQGIINEKSVFDYGYLLGNVEITGDIVKYRGVEIKSEDLQQEKIVHSGIEIPTKYPYVKINGVKYYYDEDNQKWFSIMNGIRYDTNEKFNSQNNTSGKEYYKEAYNFTQKILNKLYTDVDGNLKSDGYSLADLKGSNAVDDKGNSIEALGNYPIFDNENIEYPNSNFNQQRLAVIRYSIEKNLSIAIANYNNYSINNPTDFRMPKLKEDEWEKIINNVSMISFLQGLNIGGKVYNGYSIITNNKNKEVVNEDSIYILANDNQYYRPNDNTLISDNKPSIIEGVLNIDFEIKSNVNSSGNTKYFMPKEATGCYSSIVTQTGVTDTDNYYELMSMWGDKNSNLASKYFTALGRERYSMYKTNNNLEDIKKNFLEQP